MAVKVAINGFGRIGRLAFRQMFGAEGFEIVAINDLTSPKMLAHLLKYDSTQGKYAYADQVSYGENSITVCGKEITIYAMAKAAELPWAELGVDVVLECTGFYTSKDKAQAHIDAGAKHVIISAPAGNDLPTIVYNVNHEKLTSEDKIISAASCTTNCLAPISKVLDEKFGIVRGLMTTVHAATATQKTVDGPSKKDWRGGRGILENIIPSSTGAAKAVGKVLPQLNGKLTGMSMRVPTSDVSVVDLTVELKKACTYEEICAAMKEASEGELKGILGYTDEAVVSTDFRNCPKTSIFDAKAGIQLDPTFVKVVSWYDNEWGYSNKVCEMARVIAK
jgi:glyceraldehyde 3-phosphate dehydrogenase